MYVCIHTCMHTHAFMHACMYVYINLLFIYTYSEEFYQPSAISIISLSMCSGVHDSLSQSSSCSTTWLSSSICGVETSFGKMGGFDLSDILGFFSSIIALHISATLVKSFSPFYNKVDNCWNYQCAN